MEQSKKKTNTEQKLTDALFDLMEIDPIEKITVSEICACARVNRSTFYNHFSDIYDVRDRYEQTLLDSVGAVLPTLMKAKILEDKGFSADLIERALGDHFDKLKVLLNGGDPLFSNRIIQLARKNFAAVLGVDEFAPKQEYAFNALAGMQLGLLGYWLRAGRVMPLEELVELMQDLIEYGPKAVMLSVR